MIIKGNHTTTCLLTGKIYIKDDWLIDSRSTEQIIYNVKVLENMVQTNNKTPNFYPQCRFHTHGKKV